MRKRIRHFRCAYHRNGITGVPFAVIFESAGACAVFNVQELSQGNIAFARGNSWRGDHFEDTLRTLLDQA